MNSQIFPPHFNREIDVKNPSEASVCDTRMFLTTNTEASLVIHLLPPHFSQSVCDSVSSLCRRCLFPLPLE